jgi:CBS domain-containing protein
MLIEHILATKGSEVVSVAEGTSVADALAVLRSHNIGALVVTGGAGPVAGVLSERDVVRSLAEAGARTLELTVDELMTTTVFTCVPTETVEAAMALMTERRIRHIPVLDDGRLVGVVSIGDVVSSRVRELAEEARTLHEYLESGR